MTLILLGLIAASAAAAPTVPEEWVVEGNSDELPMLYLLGATREEHAGDAPVHGGDKCDCSKPLVEGNKFVKFVYCAVPPRAPTVMARCRPTTPPTAPVKSGV